MEIPDDPVGHWWPAGQVTQLPHPVVVRYWPPGHARQDDWAVDDWYWPAAQLLQADADAAEYCPAPQALYDEAAAGQ
jgi:hypothetical protein